MVNDQINVVSSGTSLYCFIRHIYSGPKENGFNVRLDFQRLPEKGELRPYPCTAGPPARPAAGPGPWPLAARGLPLPLELWGRQLGGRLATAKSFVSAGAAPRGKVRPPRARRHTGQRSVAPLPSAARFSSHGDGRAHAAQGQEVGTQTAISRHARSLDGGLSDLLTGTGQSHHTLPLPPNGRKLEK